MLGSAARASHHTFASLLLGGRGFRRFRERCGRRSQSCEQQSEDTRYGCSQSDNLEPESIRLHNKFSGRRPGHGPVHAKCRTKWLALRLQSACPPAGKAKSLRSLGLQKSNQSRIKEAEPSRG